LKIVLTGGNGFLGSHLAERLQAEGHDLRLMLRRTSNTEFLGGLKACERRHGDLRDAATLPPIVEGAEVILHLGGVTVARTEAEYQAANGAGTANLVEAAVRAGVRRFVYVSSLAAHGPSDGPKARNQDSPATPVTAYGRSKLAGELALKARQREIEAVIVRPPAVYGPRDRALLPLYRAGMLGVFPLLGDGSNLASFVYVDDAVDAITRLLPLKVASGTAYSMEDGRPHSWRELVLAFEKASGKRVRCLPTPRWLYAAAGAAGGIAAAALRRPLPLSPEKVCHISQPYWVCDSAAIHRDTGWLPKVGIEEGLARTLAWCKAQGWL
jgi:nucleoside-diphosphate-sugar epimerase